MGKMTEDGLEFTATGAGEKEANGIIKRKEDIATVTIIAPNNNVIKKACSGYFIYPIIFYNIYVR